MKIQGVASADMRVIVDGDNEGSTEVKSSQSYSFEGRIIQFRELGVGVTDADFYKAPIELSGE